MCQVVAATTKQGQGQPTYRLEVEQESDMSDRSWDRKSRVGKMTYRLGVEKKGEMSDYSCHYKMSAGTTYNLTVKISTCKITVKTTTQWQGRLTA
jgi:hypothetical protein